MQENWSSFVQPVMACTNLGGLLLVRGAMRSRELALRLATGASAGRLVRQLLTETMVLFVLGAAAGLIVASVAIEGLNGFLATGRRPTLLDVRYDWRLIVYALGVTLVTGVLTGLWPAVRALRIEPPSAMKENEAQWLPAKRACSLDPAETLRRG